MSSKKDGSSSTASILRSSVRTPRPNLLRSSQSSSPSTRSRRPWSASCLASAVKSAYVINVWGVGYRLVATA